MTVRLSATDWSAPLGWFASDWMSEPTPLYDEALTIAPLSERTEPTVTSPSLHMEKPEFNRELNPTPEHTYEAHTADVTTTLAVVLDEEGS